MKKNKKETNQLFLVCPVTADLRKNQLRLPEETIKNLNDLGRYSTKMYFQYKKKYPDYKEVIVSDVKPLPLNNIFLIERRIRICS